MDIIAINESFRYIDVVDDLIPIEDIKKSEYDFKIPTIVPTNWSTYCEITQEEYDIEFNRKHSVPMKVLHSTTNIVVAGGAAARPLYVSNKEVYTDIDIFIHGIFDEQLFWNKVNEVAEKLITLTIEVNRDYQISQKMKKGIIVIGIALNGQLIIEYQIILRMYHTISSIIHAFDIPSCCVCYDGYKTYTTTLGAYAHANQVNIAITKYRSTSFERRLVKYFNRGYGLAFIGYNVEKGYNTERRQYELYNIMQHKYLCITITDRNDNKFIGHVYTSNIYRSNIDSEYSCINPKIHSYNELVTHIQCIEDVGIILRQNSHSLIDYSKFYGMEVTDIILLYRNGIDKIIGRHCDKIQNTTLRGIKLMKFSKLVIRDIIDVILAEDEYAANKKIMDILFEQILLYSGYIPKWLIIQDPQRQYTAAINPIIENTEDWYGSDLYVE